MLQTFDDLKDGVPPRVDDPVPLVRPVVAAFGLVCGVKNSNSRDWVLQRADAFPATGVGGLWGLLGPKITVVPRVLSLVLCPTPHKGSDRRRPFLGLRTLALRCSDRGQRIRL